MEDGLVQFGTKVETLIARVLILIVVEDGLVLGLEKMLKQDVGVLILIVVEDGLVQQKHISTTCFHLESLNPYCSGRWSRTDLIRHY